MNNLHRKSLTSFLILLILLSLTLTACTNGKETTQSSTTTGLPVTDLYWDPDPATLVTSPSGVLPGNFAVIMEVPVNIP